MATKQDLNKYLQLKKKRHCIKADLFFLKKCKINHIYPNFIKIQCAISNSRTEQVIRIAKQKWLHKERSYLYSKLNDIEFELYYLHKKLSNCLCSIDYTFDKWIMYLNRVENIVLKTVNHKKSLLNKKFKKLKSEHYITPNNNNKTAVKTIDNYVTNLSSVQFSSDQLRVLNKGLKFVPKPRKIDIESTVADVETAIKYLPEPLKIDIRKEVKPILKNGKISNMSISNKQNTEMSILKTLKNEDVIYTKADKGNALVILDKTDYINRMNNTLSDSSVINLKKNPLNNMIKDAKTAIDNINSVFNVPKWVLKESNPRLPRCYGLPKIHKPGNKMRPIISSVKSPIHKIAKWLVGEFTKMKPPKSLKIKNSYELVEKLENLYINEDEIMVSFDVEQLYPSIPIPEALGIIDDWLMSQDVDDVKVNLYSELTKLCMEHNQFQFNGLYYKQNQGTSMGNPLACFIADAFMGSLETELMKDSIFPKIWLRYVDDVFTIMKKDDVNNLLDRLNNIYPSIKFTVEIENNNNIPFLDLNLERINNKINFSIYRKSTSTSRYITRDSFCHFSHKMAVFNSLIYRLCKIPLSVNNYMKELNHIKLIADVNGFGEKDITNLVQKHSSKIKKQKFTTFKNKKETSKRRVCLSFCGTISNQIKRVFCNHNFDVVFKSNCNISNMLTNTKDKIPEQQKSGIYKISCNECSAIYIGQTRRNILQRFKEHIAHVKYNRPEKSAVAEHMIENNHLNITAGDLKLIKEIQNNNQLDAWECIYINKNTNNELLNNDRGPILSYLFSYNNNN